MYVNGTVWPYPPRPRKFIFRRPAGSADGSAKKGRGGVHVPPGGAGDAAHDRQAGSMPAVPGDRAGGVVDLPVGERFLRRAGDRSLPGTREI